MKKTTKIKRLTGAVIAFNVATPESGEGELEQYAIIKVTSVFKAKSNGKYYVKGINLKRQENSVDMKFRQYQIDRIVNGTLVIVADNEWSRKDKRGQRIHRFGDKGVVRYVPKKPLAGIDLKAGLQKLRDRKKVTPILAGQ